MEVFGCGLFAGLCFCVTHPIESVKTRVQVMSAHGESKGFVRSTFHILRSEGQYQNIPNHQTFASIHHWNSNEQWCHFGAIFVSGYTGSCHFPYYSPFVMVSLAHTVASQRAINVGLSCFEQTVQLAMICNDMTFTWRDCNVLTIFCPLPGIRPLCSGIKPSMLRACSYSGIQFMAYEFAKEQFTNRDSELDWAGIGPVHLYLLHVWLHAPRTGFSARVVPSAHRNCPCWITGPVLEGRTNRLPSLK